MKLLKLRKTNYGVHNRFDCFIAAKSKPLPFSASVPCFSIKFDSLDLSALKSRL